MSIEGIWGSLVISQILLALLTRFSALSPALEQLPRVMEISRFKRSDKRMQTSPCTPCSGMDPGPFLPVQQIRQGLGLGQEWGEAQQAVSSLA